MPLAVDNTVAGTNGISTGMDSEMVPRMTVDEVGLFTGLLSCCDRYLEFGTGGSTCLASSLARTSVISVDSDDAWLGRVQAECARHPNWKQPQLFGVDIGPTGSWGWPTDPTTRNRWPDYHTRVWSEAAATGADLVMIDGRFRLSCYLQTILRGRPDVIIAMHDFAGRAAYQAAHRFGREIARTGELSVFARRPDCDLAAARRLLDQSAFDPA